ncbi:MAG: TIR domain-containing protein [Proteobacteria bacterium]|nr:TIR domain-containing protein [Pseudomonadota bacterium]
MSAPIPAVACRYSAFISYSHRDERWARWLQTALETYRVPSPLARTQSGAASRRLSPVFRDRSDLPSATDLGAHIREALQDSANLIVICSPGASVSRWVNEEIRYFRSLGRGDRIFCLIVDGEPNASDLPGRESLECFPPALRFLDDMDSPATGPRLEPVAADARPGADGKSNARLKLIAGLLGVGFDVLKQRDLRRRNRRLVLVTAFALVLTGVVTALAIEARIARKAAEQRQKQAEDLVAFMLTDLNDRLREVQRLDILVAVDNQAMAYFSSLPLHDVTDQTLALRSKALQKIGNVRQDEGQLAAAMESYLAASQLGAELLRRSPDDPEREAAYAETLNHLGNAQYFQGDRDRALESFSRAAELLARATAERPQDDWLEVLSSARTNAGRVLETRGEFEAARKLYGSVLATATLLASRQPGDVPRQADLADAHDSLGKIALEQGQLAQAIAAYRDVRRIKAELSSRSPDDRDAAERLLISNGILGRTLALCGAEVAATKHVREAVGAARALVAFDAKQADWRFWLGKYSLQLGGIARSAGRLQEAAGHDGEALQVLSDLVATDRTNSAWRRELANAQIESARLRLALGKTASADQLLAAAFATLTREGDAGRGDRNLRLLQAQAHIVGGQLATRRDQGAVAREHWIQARESIANDVLIGANPNFLSTWVSAHLLLGEVGVARPAIGQLVAMGYYTPDFEAMLATVNVDHLVTPIEKRCGSGESVSPRAERID